LAVLAVLVTMSARLLLEAHCLRGAAAVVLARLLAVLVGHRLAVQAAQAQILLAVRLRLTLVAVAVLQLAQVPAVLVVQELFT
jgi:hypothetical protein